VRYPETSQVFGEASSFLGGDFLQKGDKSHEKPSTNK